jgi:hypothetical protein
MQLEAGHPLKKAVIDLLTAEAVVRKQRGGWQVTGFGLLILSSVVAIFLLNPRQAFISATVFGIWVRVARSCLK